MITCGVNYFSGGKPFSHAMFHVLYFWTKAHWHAIAFAKLITFNTLVEKSYKHSWHENWNLSFWEAPQSCQAPKKGNSAMFVTWAYFSKYARYVDVANAQSKTLRDRRQIFSMMIKLARYFQSWKDVRIIQPWTKGLWWGRKEDK